MKQVFLTSFLLLFSIVLLAQSQNPPDINWKQIKTKNFRIIFPSEIQEYGQQTAAIIDSFYKLDTRKVILPHPTRTDLLLYNRSVVSNAYATLGPKRMVWYMTPPQSPIMALEPWNGLLAVHEFRHVTQFYEMKTGFTDLAYLFAGQYGWMGIISWAYPNWFFEGDAVYHETIFTHTGRGRLAFFSMPLRTIYLNNQKISYEKALFRSYKTYYPNHYYLGYHLVSYVNRHYGEDVWQKIMERTNKFSYWPFAIERSLKKYTGDNLRKTYKKTFAELDSLWQTDLMANLDTTAYEKIVTTKKRVWTNYFDPYVIGKDSLLMLKSGLDDNTQLILWTHGKENVIREISGSNISVAKKTAVWTTYSQNPRYGEETFNDIVKYNLKTKELKIITKKGKYFSADISHNADKICAVKYDTDIIPQIVILDTNGNEKYSYRGNVNDHFIMPLWTSDDKKIIFIKIDTDGESLLMLDPGTNTTETLIPAGYIKFDKPFVYKNYVLFNYDYTGITNIFALDLTTKKIYQVTSVKFGVSQAVVDSFANKLIFTNYQLNGLDIVSMDFNPQAWKPIKNVKQKTFEYFLSDKTEETLQPVDVGFAKNAHYTVQDYKPVKHLINPHSWGAYISSSYNAGTSMAFTVFSDDVLNTTSINYSAFYDAGIKTLNHSLGIDFKKFYPVFSFNIYGGSYGYALDKDAETFLDYDSIAIWNKVGTSLGISLPLDFSKTIYYRSLNFSLTSGYEHLFNFSDLAQTQINFSYTQILRFDTKFYFENRRLRSYRDIYPRWGEAITLGATYIPHIFELQGYRYYANADFYLPGLMKHHGIKLSFGAEQHNPADSSYLPMSNMIAFPRGYTPVSNTELYTAAIDYTLPLFYPDLNIPYLLYVKRVRFKAFADYAYIANGSQTANIYSVGGELIFDFNLLRMNFITLNAGIRLAYLPIENKLVPMPVIMDLAF